MPRLITPAVAAEIWKPPIRLDALYRHIRAGRIPVVRVGKRIYLDADAIERWAAAGGTPLANGEIGS